MVKRLLALLVVFGGLAGAVGLVAVHWYRSPIADLTTQTMIEIPTGLSLTGIGALLKSRGLVRYPSSWAVLARSDGYGLKLRAGEYVLEPQTSPQGLARQFAEGRVVLPLARFGAPPAEKVAALGCLKDAFARRASAAREAGTPPESSGASAVLAGRAVYVVKGTA